MVGVPLPAAIIAILAVITVVAGGKVLFGVIHGGGGSQPGAHCGGFHQAGGGKCPAGAAVALVADGRDDPVGAPVKGSGDVLRGGFHHGFLFRQRTASSGGFRRVGQVQLGGEGVQCKGNLQDRLGGFLPGAPVGQRQRRAALLPGGDVQPQVGGGAGGIG